MKAEMLSHFKSQFISRVANRAGLSRGTVSKFFNGKSSELRDENASAIYDCCLALIREKRAQKSALQQIVPGLNQLRLDLH